MPLLVHHEHVVIEAVEAYDLFDYVNDFGDDDHVEDFGFADRFIKCILLYIVVNIDMSKYGALLWHDLPLAAQLCCIFYLGNACVRLAESLIPGLGFRILMAPAVILHELSHVLGCMVTFAKITDITVFKREGGSVSHESPKLPFGQALISLSPFLGGWALLWGLEQITGVRHDVVSVSLGWEGWWRAQWASLSRMPDALTHGGSSILWGYGVVSCALIMVPSSQDMANARKPLGVGLVLLILADGLLWSLGRSSPLMFMTRQLSPYAVTLITFQLASLVLMLPCVAFRRLGS